MDEEIIYGLKLKKEQSITLLINQYGKILYGVIKYAANNNRIDNDLEDIFYEVILKIWNSIDLYDESKGIFRNFIISIAKYTAIDHIRKTYRTNETVLNEALKDSIEGDTNEDDISLIAKSLGQKESYIYTRLSRGRKKLKEIIGGERHA